MKTRVILPVLLIACFSCGTNNKPDSDAQKEKIIGEVKEVMSIIIKGAEEANSDIIIETCLDSPDFIASFNGNSSGYEQFADAVKTVFSTLINQKGTIRDEEYAILDNSTVLYTANSRWLMNFKDGHAILQDPWTMQYLFKKVDNKWKVISVNESGVEQSVINTEISNPLNQVDLMKQFLGSWKCEYAKDTTIYYNAKPYGNGIEGYGKIISKEKTIVEWRQLMGYDKKTDKLVHFQMFMGKDIETYVYYFTSDKKYIIIPFRNISNPDNATWKCEGEFTSPDIFVETTLEINRPPQTLTFTRVR